MTLKEIKDAIKNDPTLVQGVLNEVVGTDEGKAVLTAYALTQEKAVIDATTSKIYNGLDDDIFTATGERKANGVKSYEFLKEKLGQIAKLKSDYATLSEGDDKQTIIELNKKLKEKVDSDPITSAYFKKTIDEQAKAFEAKENELKETIQKMETSNDNAVIDSKLAMSMSRLKFDETIPQEFRDSHKKVVLDSIRANVQVIDGELVHLKEDGTPNLNNSFKPITTDELLDSKFGTLISSGGNNTKPNKGNEGTVDKQGDKAVIKLNKDSIGSQYNFQTLVNKALTDSGISPLSDEGIEMKDAAYAEYEVANLPND